MSPSSEELGTSPEPDPAGLQSHSTHTYASIRATLPLGIPADLTGKVTLMRGKPGPISMPELLGGSLGREGSPQPSHGQHERGWEGQQALDTWGSVLSAKGSLKARKWQGPLTPEGEPTLGGCGGERMAGGRLLPSFMWGRWVAGAVPSNEAGRAGVQYSHGGP